MDREEAIEIIRKNMPSDKSLPVYVALQTLIPELKESEDERIRMAIIHYILYETKGAISEATEHTWVKWLEKQKEPVVDKEGMYYYLGGKFIYCGYPATEENPYDFAMSQQEKQKEPHYTKRNALFDKCVENCDPEIMQRVSNEVDKMLKKEQKPVEWSEEDDMLMDELESYILYDKEFNDEQKSWRIKRLKSLRPSWKPSEEQMCYLLAVINEPNNAGSESCHIVLKELYEQLKKL